MKDQSRRLRHGAAVMDDRAEVEDFSTPPNRWVAEGRGPSREVGEVAAGKQRRRRVPERRVTASNHRNPSWVDEITKYGSFCTSSFEAL